MITPLLRHTINPCSRSFDPNAQCAYHSDAQGHNIEDCRDLKREIEKMIQDRSIIVKNIDNEENSSHADLKTQSNAETFDQEPRVQKKTRAPELATDNVHPILQTDS
ncbi:hypothetical protein T459_17153 [Capsicum annuum]|uniref:Gag-pol polyprotein n=1 Tax=Capsicum annuum TaxID=4072 RepID=A0A2G2ZB16_CAPAN|nr:hypothetical protein T459_17153 [Capsicum annuum]